MKHLISYIHFNNQLNIKKLKHFQECLVDHVFDGEPIDKEISYPAIQFKLFEKNLFVVAFDDYGIKFIDKIINSDLSSMKLDETGEDLKISRVYVKNYKPEFSSSMLDYKLKSYIPFHTASYVSFRALDGHEEKQRTYLKRFVKRHLSQFIRFVSMDKNEFNKNLQLDIEYYSEKPTRLLYNTMLKPFDIKVKINLILPSCIGLGRFNKYGFGNITPFYED